MDKDLKKITEEMQEEVMNLFLGIPPDKPNPGRCNNCKRTMPVRDINNWCTECFLLEGNCSYGSLDLGGAMLSKKERDEIRRQHNGLPTGDDERILSLLDTCDELEDRNAALLGAAKELYKAADPEQNMSDIPLLDALSRMKGVLNPSIRTSLEPCLECGLPTSSPPHLVNGRCPANPDEVEV